LCAALNDPSLVLSGPTVPDEAFATEVDENINSIKYRWIERLALWVPATLR
jgi:hypothetical protein